MIKVVIYDSDGMLTYGERFSDAYSKKYEIPLEKIAPFFQGPFSDCIIGKSDLKEELSKGWLEKWGWTNSVDDLLLYWLSTGSDVNTEILDTLKKVKAKCLLATNQEKYRTDYLMNELGLGEYFDKVFSSAHLGFKKPSKEFFDEILMYLKESDSEIKKEEILFWDDDLSNISGAKDYGLETAIFTDTESYMSEMVKRGLL